MYRSYALLFCLFLSFSAAAQNSLNDAIFYFLQTQTQGLPGKVSYRMGTLEPRLAQATCPAFEVFLPQGGKLWGKATLGVRCANPHLSAYVPVEISVIGHYLVAARTLNPNDALKASDALIKEGDLTQFPTNVLSDPSQLSGKVLKNRITQGQPIREDALQMAWLVRQGQSVKTVARGEGFSVASEGKALSNAALGQSVQIRSAGGQVVSGVVLPDGSVDVTK